METDSAAIVRAVVEGLWAGRLSEAEDHPGYWSTLHTFGLVRDAFPDLTMSIQRQLTDADVVVTVFELTGTHHGPLLGAEPTGRTVTWTVVYVDTVQDGKVVEHTSGDGWIDMLMAIGALPPPG